MKKDEFELTNWNKNTQFQYLNKWCDVTGVDFEIRNLYFSDPQQSVDFSDIQAVRIKPTEIFIDNIVLHLPEKWMYEKIVELVGWYDNEKKLDYWNEYEQNIAVKINNNKIQKFCTWRFYQDFFPSYKFMEYNEFMAEFFPEILKEKPEEAKPKEIIITEYSKGCYDIDSEAISQMKTDIQELQETVNYLLRMVK